MEAVLPIFNSFHPCLQFRKSKYTTFPNNFFSLSPKGTSTNYNYHQPFSQKLNTIKNLKKRALTPSSEFFWEESHQKFQTILKKNIYPTNIIRTLLNKPLQKKANQNVFRNTHNICKNSISESLSDKIS